MFWLFYSFLPLDEARQAIGSWQPLQLIICLIFAIFIYVLFSRLPLYILRKVRSNTIFVSAIITVIITLLPQLTSQLFDYVVSKYNYKITPELISQLKLSSELSHLANQPFMIYTENFLLKQIGLSFISGYTSYIVAELTFSVLIGGLVITSKLAKKECEAQNMYRIALLRQEYNYSLLKEISYLGGDMLELQIISNVKFLEIIQQNENNVDDDPRVLKDLVKQYLKDVKKALK